MKCSECDFDFDEIEIGDDNHCPFCDTDFGKKHRKKFMSFIADDDFDFTEFGEEGGHYFED
ncbi:MAG TPA: hypothetical protein PLH46_00760 [Caldisericia bacterium]|nr:hypothetical protein [Caldisericia bacterium]